MCIDLRLFISQWSPYKQYGLPSVGSSNLNACMSFSVDPKDNILALGIHSQVPKVKLKCNNSQYELLIILLSTIFFSQITNVSLAVLKLYSSPCRLHNVILLGIHNAEMKSYETWWRKEIFLRSDINSQRFCFLSQMTAFSNCEATVTEACQILGSCQRQRSTEHEIFFRTEQLSMKPTWVKKKETKKCLLFFPEARYFSLQ